LYCIALHCIALHCIALHCIALHCIALHCIALHCIALKVTELHQRNRRSKPGPSGPTSASQAMPFRQPSCGRTCRIFLSERHRKEVPCLSEKPCTEEEAHVFPYGPAIRPGRSDLRISPDCRADNAAMKASFRAEACGEGLWASGAGRAGAAALSASCRRPCPWRRASSSRPSSAA
jgi:hypothetical protein